MAIVFMFIFMFRFVIWAIGVILSVLCGINKLVFGYSFVCL